MSTNTQLCVAITKDGKIVGYISGENHTTKRSEATVYRNANHAAQLMILARKCHPAWNVAPEFGLMIVNA